MLSLRYILLLCSIKWSFIMVLDWNKYEVLARQAVGEGVVLLKN